MKRTILVVLLACALVAVFAGTAFAQGFGVDAGAYPGYLIEDARYGPGTVYKEALASPHGNFTLASEQCAVCHSVHHAPATDSLALLAGYQPAAAGANSADGACVFCHVDTTIGYIQVYDGDYLNFTNASDAAHDAAGNASCSNCHQVHAATASMPSATDAPYLVQKILQNGVFDAAFPAGPAADEVQVSIWCTQCHSGYYSNGQAYDGSSHIMTDFTTDYNAANPTNHGPAGQIAVASSATCRGCHSRGEINQAPAAIADPVAFVQPSTADADGGSFPHFTDGARFLQAATALDADGIPTTSGGASNSHGDAVCYSCHRGNALIGSGVGIGW